MRFSTFSSLVLCSALATVNAVEIRSCTEPNTIALTFDDGPYQYTENLLEQLKTKDIHATFFINGNNWWTELSGTPNEQVIGKIAAAGHQVASHTYNHAIPATKEEIEADFKKMGDLIEKNAGYRPTYFRAPKGECDENCISFIESLGYKIINWDTDTNDWNYAQFQSDKDSTDPKIVKKGKEANVEHVKKFLTEEFAQKRPNYLVLMHDVQNHTVEKIIPWLLENLPEGYKFVTVAECLGDATLGKLSAATDKDATVVNGTQTENVTPSVVQGNSTFDLQTDSPSGANTVIYNIYIVAALLAYSLYMML